MNPTDKKRIINAVTGAITTLLVGFVAGVIVGFCICQLCLTTLRGNMNSEKDIKDFLHLYLGCEVQYPNTDGGVMRAIFTGFSRADGVETTYKGRRKAGEPVGDYLSWKPNGWHKCNAKNIKPILRKLSSMTEEEKQQFLALQYENGDKVFTEDEKNILLYNPTQFTPDGFRYLLSRGFDLFGLIESGLAIDKETIKP